MRSLTKRRDLPVTGDDKRHFISAASALAKAGSLFHVVADGGVHLASFAEGSDEPGFLMPLIDEEAPAGGQLSKREKPDFECLVRLPSTAYHPHGALLAMGSGSAPRRRRGALVEMDAEGHPASSRSVGLELLFGSGIKDILPDLNIEGALADTTRFLLFHRANIGDARNAIIEFTIPDIAEALLDRMELPSPSVRFVELGETKGARFRITDVCRCPNGILFTAVAESTSSSYDEGTAVGGSLGLMSDDFEVLWERLCKPLLKYEVIDVTCDDGRTVAYLVDRGGRH